MSKKSGTFTGNNAWLKLQALNKPKKSRKRKNSTSKSEKSSMDVKSETDQENHSPLKTSKSMDDVAVATKKNEVELDNSENEQDHNPDNLKVQSSKDLLNLLKSESKVRKQKYDSSQWDEELIKVDDVQMAFGHEAAFGYSQKLKTKEAKFYRKRFLDADEARKFDDPDFKPTSITELNKKLIKSTKDDINLTKFLAIDCEMVGVGFKGKKSILARVSICNLFGKCVYDKFVQPGPGEEVVDYRTEVSGVRARDLLEANGALPFEIIKDEVSYILKNRVLVGHQLNSDLKVLKIKHPGINIRDTAKYFTKQYGNTPSLKRLVKDFLEIGFQTGEHSSVQDAQATMKIYTMHKKQWEKEIFALKERYEENLKSKAQNSALGSSVMPSKSSSSSSSKSDLNQNKEFTPAGTYPIHKFTPKKSLQPNESAISNVVYKKSPKKSRAKGKK